MKNPRHSIIILLLAVSFCGSAQSKKILLKEAFTEWEARPNTNIRFFYLNEWIKNIYVDLTITERELKEFVDTALQNTDLAYILYQERYIVLFPKMDREVPSINRLPKQALQQLFQLQGRIIDGNSKESIPGTTLYVPELGFGATSDANGQYRLDIPKGIYTINITAVGKATITNKITIGSNQVIDFEMYDEAIELNEVMIKGDPINKNVTSVEMSLVKLDTRMMKRMPKFMGETDIIKSITLMPGVSTVGEGSGGFNVRGGNVDQNLVLLDDVPVFNTSHLFGLITAFNPDVVKDITLYKAGMPAQYGGRISSVLDIKIRDSDSKKIAIKGSAGILSSKLTVEGPLIKDKTTFILSSRYGYPNWLVKKVPNKDIRNSAAFFYDANAIFKHRINQKNTLHFSAYSSNDVFKLASDTAYAYSTFNTAIKLNSLITKKLFAGFSGSFNDYTYSIKGLKEGLGFESKFGIKSLSAKADFSIFYISKNKIDVGMQVTHYQFKPGGLVPSVGSSLNPKLLQNEQAIESAIYASDEFTLNQILSFQGGIRLTTYSNTGPARTFVYAVGEPKTLTSVIDTLYKRKHDRVATYYGFEPRLSVKIALRQKSSVKVSYNKNIQYLHLISNTTAISPIDIWKSSGYNIKPQTGHQFAVGYFKNFERGHIELSAEAYYKKISNMLEYKDGADLFLNPAIETQVLPAFGKMYGAELLLRKNEGRLTGWITYTYSRAFRQVNQKSTGEKINGGQYYPSNFDRPHNFSIVLNQKFSKRISLSANFTYNSGRPVTYPERVFIVDGYTVVQYSDRNRGRISSYNRMDISLNFEESLRLTKKWKGSWNFSIYNLYGRRNQYSVFFKPTFNGKLPQAYQLSVLGTILPSITYNFIF